MTATSHAIIGTVIAAKINNPYVAIPVAIISHVAADLFPHWDSGTHSRTKKRKQIFYEAIVDVIIGFILSYLLLVFVFPRTDLLYAFFMILASQSLDWLSAPFYFFKIEIPLSKMIYKFQLLTNTRLDKPWGIINQAAILVFLILIAKLL